jgi:tetratricopeptide (TPR) repeat protein
VTGIEGRKGAAMKKTLMTVVMVFAIIAIGQQPTPAQTTVHIPSAEELAVQKVQQYPPNTFSVSDWESVLKYCDASLANKDAADKVWTAIQAMEKSGQGKLRIPAAKVIASTREGFDAAATESNKEKIQADVHVVMERPMLSPLAPGSTIDIIGVIASYTPNPFMFIVEKGELPGPKTSSYPQPAMDPDAERHFKVNIDLGNFLVKSKDYQSAASCFRKALQYKPDDAEVTFKLADSLDKAQKFEEARATYQRYLELLPTGPLAGQAKIALQRIGSASHK